MAGSEHMSWARVAFTWQHRFVRLSCQPRGPGGAGTSLLFCGASLRLKAGDGIFVHRNERQGPTRLIGARAVDCSLDAGAAVGVRRPLTPIVIGVLSIVDLLV
jgi:hypothetical protein